MKIQIPKNRIDYINNLSISEGSIKEALRESANIVAGSIILFLPGISASQKRDVIDSTLLAQLASNKAFNREQETFDWYTNYKTILENVGWQINDFTFQNINIIQQKIALFKVVQEEFDTKISGLESQLLEETLAILNETSEENKAFSIFDNNAFSKNAGNFQICIASSDSDNNISMVVGGFYFEFSQTIKPKFLFSLIKTKEINLYANVMKIKLNEQIYGTVRKDIIDKLGNLPEKLTTEIDLC